MSRTAFGEIRDTVNGKALLEEPSNGWGVDISGQPLPLKDLLDAIKADAGSAAFLGKILDARLMLMIKAIKDKYIADVNTETAMLAGALEGTSGNFLQIWYLSSKLYS